MSKVRVDVETIMLARAVLTQFNRLDLHEVELREHGQVLNVPEKFVEDFLFTGLSNSNFIEQGIYKYGMEE